MIGCRALSSALSGLSSALPFFFLSFFWVVCLGGGSLALGFAVPQWQMALLFSSPFDRGWFPARGFVALLCVARKSLPTTIFFIIFFSLASPQDSSTRNVSGRVVPSSHCLTQYDSFVKEPLSDILALFRGFNVSLRHGIARQCSDQCASAISGVVCAPRA